MKKTEMTFPAADGFRMPGEFEPHRGCLMIWPRRPGSWKEDPTAARKAFAQVARAIAESEKVYMLAYPEDVEEAARTLGCGPVDLVREEGSIRGTGTNIEVIPMKSDDSWARDVGPTFVVKGKSTFDWENVEQRLSKDEVPDRDFIRQDYDERLRGIDWTFNAWGGEVDGLYASWDLDDLVARQFCDHLGLTCYDARPFVLEGGSIHSDGQGTVIVTETCLLSAGRNPSMTKEEITKKLCDWLGAGKVIWLPYGIYNDETNEHVDNVCAFTKPGQVVLAWTDDQNDPQYAMSKADLDLLEAETDARGRKIEVVKLPIPAKKICIQEEDLEGFSFEEGEDTREVGERLAASYVNFYISNGAVVLPQFSDRNDGRAVEILARCFPDREIKPIYARDILLGGGNIHCITQQIPK